MGISIALLTKVAKIKGSITTLETITLGKFIDVFVAQEKD